MMEPNNDDIVVEAVDDADGGNNDEDADDDDDDNEEEVEEEEEEDDEEEEADDEEEDVVLDPVEINQLYDKVAAIIQQRDNLPVRTRTNMLRFAQQFLDNVRDDIHDMITDTRTEEEGYAGLDSERDTEAEVSTALGFFPQTLSERGRRFGLYPIHCILAMSDDTKWVCNVQAVSFVHLFALFAIERNLFEADQRGGLLIGDGHGDTVLSEIVTSSSGSHNEDHQQLVDTAFLALLVRLRQSDLFKKEDIQRYSLLHELCGQTVYFPEQRFRFLTVMDPLALISIDNDGECLLLHDAAQDSVERFRHVFETGMRYFPHKIGLSLLFRKNHNGETPLELACGKNCKRRNEVMDAVEATLTQYATTTSTTPLNIRDALILAAIDERIHLNGLYFLIRRQPDTMLGMLHLHEELTPSSSAFRATYRNEDNDRGNTDSNT